MKKTLRVLALVAGASFLSSCATITKDPVMCGVIGSVLGAAAGAAIGAAVADNPQAFGGILGGTLGGAAGGFGGYQLCKYPEVDSTGGKKAGEKAADE